MSVLRTWLPCLGTFLVQMTIFGIHNNFGLIFHHLIIEFNESAAETAWIGSFAMGVTFLLSPLANAVLTAIGFDYTMLLATFLCVTSLVSSSFVRNVHLLSLTYSIVWGCGSALANQASFVIIQKHYRGRLSLANGIASSGTGTGTLVVGPFLEYVLGKYHFRWAFRLCAATPLFFLFSIFFLKISNTNDTITTSVVVNEDKASNVTFADNEGYELDTQAAVETNMEGEEKSNKVTLYNTDDGSLVADNGDIGRSAKALLTSIIDKELWKIRSYTIFIIGVSLFLFGYFIPFVFLVQIATELGIKEGRAQLCISVLSIISTITKIVCGYLLDSQKRFRISTIVLAAMYVMSLSHLVAGFATKYWHFMLFSVVFGVCEGCFVGQLCAIVTDIVPNIQLVPTGISNLYAFMSLSLMIGPVVAGKLGSLLHSFAVSFYVAAGISLCGTVIATLLKIFEHAKPPTEHQDQRQEVGVEPC